MQEKVTELDKFLRDNYITKAASALHIDKVKCEVDKNYKRIEDHQSELQKLQKEIKDLAKVSATKTETKDIRAQIENLCKYEDLEILYNKV